ncbi:MAG: 30S ribosomal protein S17 [bacterium]
MKKVLTGIITSNKTKDTVVVQVERILKHSKYLRRYKRHKNYKAQAVGEFSVGDKVQIKECKPISKDKRWKVVKVLVAVKKEEIAEEITEEAEEEKKEETK